MTDRIAILGDFNPVFQTLHKLNDSTRDIQKFLDREIQFDWISTDVFNCKVVFGQQNYKGLWIAPGSPYKDMDNVLKVIKYARAHKIPTFGNCGGFQHMIIEFAKNVCGIENAMHEETHPESQDLLIKKLTCSLKGKEEHLRIIAPSSIVHQAHKSDYLLGRYYCSYGIKYLGNYTKRQSLLKPMFLS